MIIICPNEIKEKILMMETSIHNYKFYTLNEIKAKVFFKYHNLALYEIVKEYKVKPSIAKNMLDSLYYIDKSYNSKKLKKLLMVKEYLTSKQMLIYDQLFLKNLKDQIIIKGYAKTKELTKIMDVLAKYTNVTFEDLDYLYDLNKIYEFKTMEDEIRFVSENILELLSKNIDINKIFVINANKEYIPFINRIFSFAKIPYNFNIRKKITMFPIVKEFLKFIKTSSLKIKDLEQYLKELNSKYNNEEIINKIINVLNKYYDADDELSSLYDVIVYELNNEFISEVKYKNVVTFTNYNHIFNDDDFVFCISCNEGILPLIHIDNEYLKNADLNELYLDDSFNKNVIEADFVYKKLTTIKNLYLSYKLESNNTKYVVSSIFNDVKKEEYQFKNNSLNYNNYLFKKLTPYDNKYQNIKFESLQKYLDNKLNLSYSSMDQFFKCQFRFYLNNILKIEPVVETMAIKVGKMFHKILERTLSNHYENYLKIVDEEITNYMNSNLKEKFYGQKLKQEVIKLIETLKKRSEISDFKDTYFEQFLIINKEAKINIKVLGFVDKIMIFNDGINNYVMVVDYKTGSVSTDLTKVKDGLNMQLLMYLYLIKNTSKITNPVLAGAYIEHILDELKPAEKGKTYAEIEKNNCKLEGITTNDKNIIAHIDNNYDVSSFIKGMKVKSDGDFYSYAKVYSEEQFNKLLELVDQNINKVIQKIEECDFKINPKKYMGSNDITGCEFCPFKEICYRKPNDIELLKETTLEEIMEG